ncbi:polar flagellar assembly protein FliO [Bdellovibrio bacteriovorus]|uniref:Polar flagellar assembly protein FliO n=1 Tax=Bdellovibrio bacteriovorus TaxID=959 RepID=A0A162GLC3_BDEBC|nr:flagellar biosynthetic protein FliO [Bdellovibrio bacteriovorus]KYG68432.1 polar flagellar assembly protein FliO [Bdellovibrio bacteriovorus]
MRLLLSLLFVFSVSAQAADSAATSSEQTEISAPAEAGVVAHEDGKIDNRKESEIPLNLDKNKKAASEGGGFFRILFTLSILGLVGTGAFIFLRKYSVPKAKKHQTQIKVLQQHFLGPKKSLAIVRVAGESILIGVTDHNISMIKSLSLLDEEVPEETPQSFGKVLGSKASFDEDSQEEASAPRKKAAASIETDDEFAISGIKDIVSKRLKGMRSLQ